MIVENISEQELKPGIDLTGLPQKLLKSSSIKTHKAKNIYYND
jgi:hypothetical protein